MAIKLGSIFGIPLFLDYSWFIILALIIYTVGFGIMPAQYPGLSLYTYLALGALSAFLLFVSIVVHELAHSIIAKRNGLQIGKITLYLLGGITEMKEEPPSSSLELRISAAGPFTSLAIAGACFLGYIISLNLNLGVIVQGPLQYSALFNLIIAGFNLIPAFPMDGGRVLRSIIWRFSGDLIRSTRIASTVGRIFAYAMMISGVFITFLVPALIFDGLWFVVLGWFISSGAQNEYKQTLIQRDVADLKARDMMMRDFQKVSPDSDLTEVSSLFSGDKQFAFPVISGNEIIGCVTWKDYQNARKKKKDQYVTLRVSDIMIPREKLVMMKESDSAKKVLALVGSSPIGIAFVFSDEAEGNLVGIVTRMEVIRTIQIQENFRRHAPAEAPQGSERNISVETGMLFQVLAPDEQPEWSVSYDTSGLSLVADQLVPVAPEKQKKQFTLLAMKKGTFSVFLNHQTGGKKSSLQYTILVS